MAWGKVTRFLRAISRVSRYPEYDLGWEQNPQDNDGWEYQAMRYTPEGVTPGNHP